MKKILLISIIPFLWTSCNSKEDTDKSIVIESIEKDIYQNAAGFGVDIKYQPGQLDTEMVVTNKMYLDYVQHISEGENTDTLVSYLNQTVEQAKKANDAKNYHASKLMLGKLMLAKSKAPDSINYTVYKYSYTIVNIMDSTKRVPVTNFYFLDSDGDLLARVSESDLSEYKYNNIDHKMSPYEEAMFDFFVK